MNILVYTGNSCHYCTELKDWLYEKELSFEEVNVSTDIEARKDLMAKGFASIPVIKIDGFDYIQGFNKEKLSKILSVKP